MRKFVTKEITQSSIEVCEVGFDMGELKETALEPITVYGKITQEKAKKIVGKVYKGKTILVKAIQEITTNYRMPVEDFIANAEIYVPKSTENTEE